MRNDFEVKIVRVKNITGAFYQIPGSKNRRLVIYAKGAPTVPDDGKAVDVPVILDYEVDLFIPDYLGYGRSEGAFTPEGCIQTLLNLYEYFTKGCELVSNYGKLKIQTKYKEIYFIGMSFGGAYVPLLPRFNPKIKNICLLCPVLDYKSQGKIKKEEKITDFMDAMTKDGYQHLYRGITDTIWKKHFKNNDGFSPMDNIQFLKNSKVFIGHGTEDQSIHHSKSIKYYQKLLKLFPHKSENFALKIYKGGDHSSKTTHHAIKDYFSWVGVPRLRMSDDKVWQLNDKYLLSTYLRRNVVPIEGEGIYLISKNRVKYFDLLSNYGVNILGYGNKKLENALISQIKMLPALHCSMATEIRSKAVEKLFQMVPRNLKQVFLSNSGTESVEAALKFAVFATGRKKFIAAKKSYHGKTLASLSVTDSLDDEHKELFSLFRNHTTFVEFGNIDKLKAKISEEYACMIVEPVQGQGGIFPAPKGYLTEVRKLCNKFGVLLVVDEVQTGLGRTGTFLNLEQHNVDCDILCLAKGLGGGIPLGATLVTEKVASKLHRQSHTTTNGGNTVAMAGMLATLDAIEELNLAQNAKEVGLYFMKGLKKLKNCEEVRGVGLMIGFKLSNGNGVESVRTLLNNRIIAGLADDDATLRFLPPLIISKQEVDEVLEILNSLKHFNS